MKLTPINNNLDRMQTSLNKAGLFLLLITALLLTRGAAYADDFVYPGTMCQGTSSDLGYSGPERTYSVYSERAWVTCPVPRHPEDYAGYEVTVYARDRNWTENIECELKSYRLSGQLFDSDFVSSSGRYGNVESFTANVRTKDRGPVVLECLLPSRGGAGGSSITFYRVFSGVRIIPLGN